MKVSKTAWLILGLGIFIIAAVALYMIYTQQGRAQAHLNEALATAQATIPRLAEERANLESTLTEGKDKLAQVTSQLNRARARFPTSVESIEMDEQLFSIADEWNLDITILTASEPSDNTVEVTIEGKDVEVEDVTYLVTYFSVNVRGEVLDILGFVNTIATRGDFGTTAIELVHMTVPEPLTEEEKEELTEAEIEEAETPSATINLTIYSYKGE